MADQYPESFPIEIERDKLCFFYRLQSFFACSFLPVFFGVLFGAAGTRGERQRDFDNAEQVWSEFFRGALMGCAIGLLIGLILYLVFGYFTSRRSANELEVSVEGPFLRIKTGPFIVQDRKLHFRAVVDYATFQNPLMRFCGIEGILMTTMSGGQHSTVRVHGIKNALEVRDMLSDIDRLREDA